MLNENFYLKRVVLGAVFALLGMLIAESAVYAQSPSHAYINTQRSSSVTHYSLSVGVVGEYGEYLSSELVDEDSNDEFSDEKVNKVMKWQGYGVKNELGIEYLKFLQFQIGHTSLHMRSNSDSSENLTGSRFNAGGGLNFYAPLGNLKLGGGFLMSRYDYHRQENAGGYYGSGYYYSLGYNYFLSQRISFYAEAFQNVENIVRNSGNKDLPANFKANTGSVGLGFNIWL